MSKGRLRWEGDRSLWIISLSLAVISLLSVYSASSHIAYLYGSGDIGKIVVKHLGFLVTGFGLMYVAHKFPYKRFGPLALLLLPLVAILLVVTLMQGQTINEANASRWLRVGGMSFQTSALAGLVLLVYVARFLSLNEPGSYTFKTSFIQLLLPVLLVCGLILPANLSTALMLFLLALLLMFVGRYPMGYMLRRSEQLWRDSLFSYWLSRPFRASATADTWESRITGFFDGSAEEGYQVQKAKMAIAQGGLFGKGPGKSKLKHFLPQSNSDFIYAVIVEEYGFVGSCRASPLFHTLFQDLEDRFQWPDPFRAIVGHSCWFRGDGTSLHQYGRGGQCASGHRTDAAAHLSRRQFDLDELSGSWDDPEREPGDKELGKRNNAQE